MARRAIFLSSIFCFLFIAGSSQNASPGECKQNLNNVGASKMFDIMVAHGIHSMTVDDLKKFDPSATEDNYVPTINIDLRSDQPLLPYAPDRKTNDTDTFLTDSMKVIDLVLTHMDNKEWDVIGYGPLERVVHAFHMREIWAHAKLDFDKIGNSLRAPDNETCGCILDVENNGILTRLRIMAMTMREPDLVFGNKILLQRRPKEEQEEHGRVKRSASNVDAGDRSVYRSFDVQNYENTIIKGDRAIYMEAPDTVAKKKRSARMLKEEQEGHGRVKRSASNVDAGDRSVYNVQNYENTIIKGDRAIYMEAPDTMTKKKRDTIASSSPSIFLKNAAISGLQPLKNAAIWQKWKGSKEHRIDSHHDLALYLHCAFEKARSETAFHGSA